MSIKLGALICLGALSCFVLSWLAVIIHEYGHVVAGRRSGIRTVRFEIGTGRLGQILRRSDKTEYSARIHYHPEDKLRLPSLPRRRRVEICAMAPAFELCFGLIVMAAAGWLLHWRTEILLGIMAVIALILLLSLVRFYTWLIWLGAFTAPRGVIVGTFTIWLVGLAANTSIGQNPRGHGIGTLLHRVAPEVGDFLLQLVSSPPHLVLLWSGLAVTLALRQMWPGHTYIDEEGEQADGTDALKYHAAGYPDSRTERFYHWTRRHRQIVMFAWSLLTLGAAGALVY